MRILLLVFFFFGFVKTQYEISSDSIAQFSEIFKNLLIGNITAECGCCQVDFEELGRILDAFFFSSAYGSPEVRM